jgi:hypothetical protein
MPSLRFWIKEIYADYLAFGAFIACADRGQAKKAANPRAGLAIRGESSGLLSTCHLRAGRPERVAYSSTPTGPHHHGRYRPSADGRWAHRGSSWKRLAKGRPATTSMQDNLNGDAVNWQKPVTDQQ